MHVLDGLKCMYVGYTGRPNPCVRRSGPSPLYHTTANVQARAYVMGIAAHCRLCFTPCSWARPARELLDGVHCPELLKTLIEAAQATTAAGGAAAGGAPAAREQGAHGAGQGQQGQQGQEQGGAAQAE